MGINKSLRMVSIDEVTADVTAGQNKSSEQCSVRVHHQGLWFKNPATHLMMQGQAIEQDRDIEVAHAY